MTPMETLTAAHARAEQELEPRAAQMTAVEYQELVMDRARELAGLPRLARLSGGTRLKELHFTELALVTGQLLSDFEGVATLGDARLYGTRLAIMFRLAQNPAVSYTVEVILPKNTTSFIEAGMHAAVTAYDALTPERVAQLLAAKPIA